MALCSAQIKVLNFYFGLETVNLKGKYFTAHVENGAKVKTGELLVEFDLNSIKNDGYNTITPVVVTNTDDYIRTVPMFKSSESVQTGDCILTIV